MRAIITSIQAIERDTLLIRVDIVPDLPTAERVQSDQVYLPATATAEEIQAAVEALLTRYDTARERAVELQELVGVEYRLEQVAKSEPIE